MSSSVCSRGFAFASLIMTLVLVISCSIFIVKPLFYVVQSYCGGCYSDEEVLEITIDESGDMARHEKTEMEARIVVGGGIGLFCIALLNAWVCLRRLNNNCIKSPVNKAVGCFVFNLLAVVVISTLKFMLDAVAKENNGTYIYEEMNMFNVFDFIVYAGLLAVLISLINVFTATLAKKALSKI